MKRIALAMLLFVSPLFAADKQVIPVINYSLGGFLCVSIRGLDKPICGGAFGAETPDLDLFRGAVRNFVDFAGFQAANAYYPPPLTKEQEAQRELGRKVMAAAPYLAFPELGDPITKDTPAVAYCSSSVGNDVLDPFNAQNVKATGKGRCQDLMTVYLRPAGK